MTLQQKNQGAAGPFIREEVCNGWEDEVKADGKG
jgi:hypothetical protein